MNPEFDLQTAQPDDQNHIRLLYFPSRTWTESKTNPKAYNF